MRKLLQLPNFFSYESQIAIALKLRKLLHLYQKVFLKAVENKKVNLGQIPKILQYIKTFYIFSNDLFLNNPAVCNLEDLKDLKKLEEIQNNQLFIQIIDNETLLIIQALKICNAILTELSNHATVNILAIFVDIIKQCI